MNLEQIQDALKATGVDGWLFYDHHRRDPLAYRILGLPVDTPATRRWYYLIPAHGVPRGLVHRIEAHTLDKLPGDIRSYSKWTEQRAELARMVADCTDLVMQHSPDCAIPYVAMVDAGTLDLIRSLGVRIRTSADLVQLFEARWNDEQIQSHFEAARRMDQIRSDAFKMIRDAQRYSRNLTEIQVKQFVLDSFAAQDLITDHGPIVAVNANASDPHYEPTSERNSPIQKGDLVLIDMWAKLNSGRSVYYDITWTGYCGDTPPERIEQVFRTVTEARDAGVRAVQSGEAQRGCDVDDVVRGYIAAQGFGEYFVHRTGHSIGTDVHGAGANMDNFETNDNRRLLPRTCFSIEPGIYLPEFGIRSEVNVLMAEAGPVVTGEVQRDLLLLA